MQLLLQRPLLLPVLLLPLPLAVLAATSLAQAEADPEEAPEVVPVVQRALVTLLPSTRTMLPRPATAAVRTLRARTLGGFCTDFRPAFASQSRDVVVETDEACCAVVQGVAGESPSPFESELGDRSRPGGAA